MKLEVRFSLPLVGTVTAEAVLREDRVDVTIEAGGLVRGGEAACQKEPTTGCCGEAYAKRLMWGPGQGIIRHGQFSTVGGLLLTAARW